MQSKYDVIVVGAGPAGSVAAEVVASSGYKTLVLERRQEIGIPVQCGEYLPTRKEMHEMFPRCDRLQKLGKIPSELITNRTQRMLLYSPRFREYDFPLESNVIDRALFDKYLAERASSVGAEIQLRARVLAKATRNMLKIRTKKGIEYASGTVVIGADGPRSVIAKYLGYSYHDSSKDVSQSLQYVIRDIPKRIEQPMMFFGHSVAPGGYAWIIPKTNHIANVGFGLRKSFMKSGQNLAYYLNNIIKDKRILSGTLRNGKIIARVGASIPVGGPLRKSYSENALLVGDAAGHVMASNGGGIPTALAGGSIAGEVAVEHLQNGSSLATYEADWKYEIGTELFSALATLRIADMMMRDDSLTEVAMRLAGVKYLEDVIKCRVPTPLSFGTPLLKQLMMLL